MYLYLNKRKAQLTASRLYYSNIEKTTINVESTLSIAPDNYSEKTGYKSYFFRGDVENNFIEFNNMCWRIVRIEGDGSVKITLAKQDLCSTITENDTGSAFIGIGDYGYKDNFYLDYENEENRTTSMKYKVNEWFNAKMSNVSNRIKTSNICIGNRAVMGTADSPSSDGETLSMEIMEG